MLKRDATQLALIAVLTLINIWCCPAGAQDSAAVIDSVAICAELFSEQSTASREIKQGSSNSVQEPLAPIKPSGDVYRALAAVASQFYRVVESAPSFTSLTEPLYRVSYQSFDHSLFLFRVVVGMGTQDATFYFPGVPATAWEDQYLRERISKWRAAEISGEGSKGKDIKTKVDLIKLRGQVAATYSQLVQTLLLTHDLQVDLNQLGVKEDGREYLEEARTIANKEVSEKFFSLSPDPSRRLSKKQIEILIAYNQLSTNDRKLLYGYFVARVPPAALARLLKYDDANEVLRNLNDVIAKLNSIEMQNTEAPSDETSNDINKKPPSAEPKIIIRMQHYRTIRSDFPTYVPELRFKTMRTIKVPAGFVLVRPNASALHKVQMSKSLENLARKLKDNFYFANDPIIDQYLKVEILEEHPPNDIENSWANLPETLYRPYKKEIDAINGLPPHLRVLFFLKYVVRMNNASIQRLFSMDSYDVKAHLTELRSRIDESTMKDFEK